MNTKMVKVVYRSVVIVLISLLLCCSGCASISQIDQDRSAFFVATDGRDDNPGTFERPFATIQRARDEIRKYVKEGLARDMTVYIREGIYRVTEPIEFTLADSGTEQFGITYLSYKREKVIIDGGKVIDGWRVNADGIWQAKVGDDVPYMWELFLNGRRLQRARHPNTGYFRAGEAVNQTDSFQFKNNDIPKPDDYRNVELIFLHDWNIGRSPIREIDLENNIVTTQKDIGFNTWWSCIGRLPDEPYYLENSVTFLDQPGEWFFDEPSSTLYYVPLSDESIETAEFVVPAAEQLLSVKVPPQEDQFIENLHFKGLTFQYCRWVPKDRHFLEMQAGFHGECGVILDEQGNECKGVVWHRMPAALDFEMTKNSSLEECTLTKLGKAGVSFARSCTQNRIVGNRIYDIAGTGIMVGEGSRKRNTNNQVWWKANPEQAASHNTISNNLIETCGQIYFGSVGIWVGLSHHNTIAHNLIRDLPYTGVSVGWMWGTARTPCYHNRIENNHIHNVMIVLSDGAGIYILGTQEGTTIRGNLVYDVVGTKARAPNNGLRWDKGGGGVLVTENLVYNINEEIMHFNPETHDNTITGNFFGLAGEEKLVRFNKVDKKETIKIEDNRLFTDTDSEEFKKLIETYEAKTGLRPRYRKMILSK